MAQLQVALAVNYPTNQDQPKVKRSLPHQKFDLELSKWDRARHTSKTWSMQQD